MKNNTIDTVLNKRDVSRAEKIRLVLSMSLPAILAQLTSIAMQYIDAGMVGSLGAEATASIGLVSSSTWLIGGSCIGIAAGFYVQVAQLIGAGRDREAEDVLRQGLKAIILLGDLLPGRALHTHPADVQRHDAEHRRHENAERPVRPGMPAQRCA